MIWSDGRCTGDWSMTVQMLMGLKPVKVEGRRIVDPTPTGLPKSQPSKCTCWHCKKEYIPNPGSRVKKYCGRHCYGLAMKENGHYTRMQKASTASPNRK
jgi:hypothetical protein